MIMGERDYNIDFLRFVGLSLIVLAHVSPPIWLQQIRSFDVPLMVFISGLTCSFKIIKNKKLFYFNRAKRLLLPVWFFLIFIFTLLLPLQYFGLIPSFLTTEKILESFLLLDGIGYVWIIRVFLLMMLITPFLYKTTKLGNFSFLLILMGFLSLQECLVYVFDRIGFESFFFNNYILYFVGYLPVFLLGYRMRTSVGLKNPFFLSFLIIFFVSLLGYLYYYGEYIPITAFKYPPRLYYLIYGILVSMLIWLLRSHIVVYSRLFDFIGRNTIWIYLWHIPFVMFSNYFFDNWFFKYILVYVGAVCVFYIQYKILNYLNISFLNKYFQG